MNATGIVVPLELVVPVVLGLIGAIGWLARRLDQRTEQLIDTKAGKREAIILAREALREHEPELERLSYSDTSDILEVEHRKDGDRIRSRSLPPPEDEFPQRQQDRVRRFVRGEDPSTPPDPLRRDRKRS